MQTKQTYVIVEGYIHSKNGGDDKPFMRGFKIPPTFTIEQFNKAFEKKNTRSAMPNDFTTRTVSKKTWNKYFQEKS